MLPTKNKKDKNAIILLGTLFFLLTDINSTSRINLLCQTDLDLCFGQNYDKEQKAASNVPDKFIKYSFYFTWQVNKGL